MSWRAITTDDVLAEFNQQEQTLYQNVQNSATPLQAILTETLNAFVGAMNAAGYAVNDDGTVPDQLRPDVIALTRWRWLISLPDVDEAIQSKNRKEAADVALKNLQLIAQKKYGAIEDPAGTVSSGANWNSENRLILRTHPAPPASKQAPPQTGGAPYANPDAPADN
jgi:hypothetical protein